jgi:phospholipid/cholesterol/gamma-HCH transport system substrate-binding protein
LSDRKLNIITGMVAAAVIAVTLVWITGAILTRDKPPSQGRTFVAYFEDAGGIEKGDAVRIKGRRAGVVTDVDLAMRDGHAMVRVEFLIAPGTGSKWLATDRIAADSRVAVLAGRQFRRPQLVITPGSSPEEIEEGGEWKDTVGGDSDDELSKVRRMVDSFDGVIDRLHEFMDDPDGAAKIEQVMAEIRTSLDEVNALMSGLLDNTEGADAQIAALQTRLEEFASGLDTVAESLSTGLKGAEEGSASIAATAENADKEINRIAGTVSEIEKATTDTRRQLESVDLSNLGLELRRLSASLRASAAVARQDPKQAGDMPNWRKSRRYFNGDHPLPGGDLDASSEAGTAESGD